MKKNGNWKVWAAATVCAASVLSASAALPSKVCFSVNNPGLSYGLPSYFDVTVNAPGGVQKFDGWCVKADVIIVYNEPYTAEVLALDQVGSLVNFPQNLDLAAWILNQDYQGKPSLAGGNFTYGDVQVAIWDLVDGARTVGAGTFSEDRVDEIIAAALANGEGYVPGPDDDQVVALKPIAEGCNLDTTATDAIAQLILIEFDIPKYGPGTGTPGYWGQYWREWPVQEITIGGVVYPKSVAVEMMRASVAKDKRFTMFPALVAAKLNVLVGNESSCIDATIAQADAWYAMFGGDVVKGSSEAWKLGEPLYWELDDYNNGLLCAPHRD